MIIAIDGPAGSGKTTTARLAADKLSFLYFDTGAMYRAVTLAFLQSKVEISENNAPNVLTQIEISIAHKNGQMVLFLNDEDVSKEIRHPNVNANVSQVSALPQVRAYMFQEQQRLGKLFAASGGVVLDGRDIGTVVFPDAEIKIFMKADAEQRAKRRLAELKSRGDTESTLDQVLDNILSRDKVDSNRAVAPLRQADDALVLDTTSCTIQDQVDFVVNSVNRFRKN